jgi:hypothetical protein
MPEWSRCRCRPVPDRCRRRGGRTGPGRRGQGGRSDLVLAEATNFLTCDPVLAEATIFFTDKNGWAPMHTDGTAPRHRAHPVRFGVEGRHGCTTLFGCAPTVRLSPALSTGDRCASVPIHSYRRKRKPVEPAQCRDGPVAAAVRCLTVGADPVVEPVPGGVVRGTASSWCWRKRRHCAPPIWCWRKRRHCAPPIWCWRKRRHCAPPIWCWRKRQFFHR